MNIAPSAAGARIVGLGEYQPSNVVTNDDLAKRVDTSDEWIQTRVGIKERRIAGPEDTVVSMAVAAGGKALADAGLSPDDIDLVIVATCTLTEQIPNAAARVAARLGVTAPGAFDVNAACAGFSYALGLANDAIRSGSSRNALVIGSEKLSEWIDWDDRSTCVIFADGAGAAVVSAAETPGIGPVVWGSSGERAENIHLREGKYLYQEGQAVFRWATTELNKVAEEALRRAGVAPTDLHAFVPHQANLRIIESIARKLGAPQAIIARDIVTAGNTSSASIPLALARMAGRGELPSGSLVLVMGFGAGLSYSAQVLEIP
ncbi:beta-ketoacyl-ACP synthase III [Streptomonospora nanhaiensis]|uniref:Beta-ketoacyl-[acyl-carrier-protein] synthase III n=1 Tax=Streptomonospora nanhaiensis TaxID=1323731 RepID=A0A853BGJ6_9ACTN|nr:beta-ketoacyl-ACP synthase III [Streptomonospora nanhaiensis]MBV2364740.1 ketoacyl-ACP synthase III [Streptomonospora nanhaiensis]MBX9389341.1 ketoacyl-ACP synthase III [Streptomonospora nanhaiensis]NYI93751.1 3-oxoacyl-[acyl-carrier-protein] synthase-3 [Streptomonospora nanhaiensis]